MAGEVTKSITAENTFSDTIQVQGYFNVSVTGHLYSLLRGHTIYDVHSQP